MAEPTRVSKGMVLLVREPASASLPERYKLWTVTSVRHGTKSSSVKLLAGDETYSATATATFPDGLVAEPWQVFGLSQRDLAHVWSALAAVGDSPPEGTHTGDAA